MNTVSIAELQRKRTPISTDAAVAIAQQLIHYRGDEPPQRPFGPPTPATVHLRSDGTVRSVSSETSPAVSEVAIVLSAMLPSGASVVPGALRYTIARALLEVDAPPFDSLQSFSEALVWFEHGDRASKICELVERWEVIEVTARRPASIERRRFAPPPDHLRRHLRDADVQLFRFQQRTDLRTASRPMPRRTLVLPALAACLAGIALIGAGEFMHSQRAVPARAVIADSDSTPPVVPTASVLPQPEALPAVSPAQRPVASMSTTRYGATRHQVRLVRHAESRSSNVSDGSRRSRRPQSHGLLERIVRLRWLKSAFTVHSAPL